MYKTILVPLDGSNVAEAILPHVEELARVLDSTLVLLHVVDHLPSSVTRGLDQASLEDLREEQKESEAYLARIQTKLQGRGVNVRASILHGRAVETIMHAAQQEKADLIAMGSHGRSGLSRAFYGSVASGVLNRIDRPLLLVRADQKQQPRETDSSTPLGR